MNPTCRSNPFRNDRSETCNKIFVFLKAAETPLRSPCKTQKNSKVTQSTAAELEQTAPDSEYSRRTCVLIYAVLSASTRNTWWRDRAVGRQVLFSLGHFPLVPHLPRSWHLSVVSGTPPPRPSATDSLCGIDSIIADRQQAASEATRSQLRSVGAAYVFEGCCTRSGKNSLRVFWPTGAVTFRLSKAS